MEMILDLLSWACIILGSIFCFIGALGLLRLPDVFARMHAAGMIDTLGMMLLLLGMAFQAGFTIVLVKLIMIAVFILYTSPTATHALSRAILYAGIKPLTSENTDLDHTYAGPTSLPNPNQSMDDKASEPEGGAPSKT